MRLTLLDGSSFVVCDQRGDLDGIAAASGFFAADTRFLSRSVLTIDGDRGEPVAFEQSAPHVAVFDLKWATGLTVRRELFVGRGLEESVTISNCSDREVAAVLTLELASDFADIFAVKRVEDLGAPGISQLAQSRPERWKDAGTVEFADEDFPARTLVHLAPAPDDADGSAARYRLRLAPGERWQLGIAVQWLLNGAPELDAGAFEAGLRDDRRERDASLAAWWRSAPQLQAPAEAALEQTWSHSLADLAALRLRWAGSEMVPAAGLPWFMTLFGRDALITSFQELLLGPEAAAGALRALAEAQAGTDDPERDAEPGKIVHELRRGKTARIWTDRYYGTVDATPLFLVLLSELWRWSGDDGIVLELEHAARRALDWIDCFGDRDGDGFVEYLRRASHGIDNQNWKDSYNSMVFHDGSLAHAPIAPVEVQGYVYDAKLRMAELARRVWRDEGMAVRLEGEAATLRERFDAAFWLPERGWYALGLDAEKRPVDALASNMGHLLWSGIVPAGRVAEVAAKLVWDRSGPAGASARSPPTSPRSIRSSTTTAPSGHTTTRSLHSASRRPVGVRRRSASCARCSTARPSSSIGCRSFSPAASGAGTRHRGSCPPLRGPRPGPPGPRCSCCARSSGSSRIPRPAPCGSPPTRCRPGSRASRSIASPPSGGTGACAWSTAPPPSSRSARSGLDLVEERQHTLGEQCRSGGVVGRQRRVGEEVTPDVAGRAG